jgi:hypothetical protein
VLNERMPDNCQRRKFSSCFDHSSVTCVRDTKGTVNRKPELA